MKMVNGELGEAALPSEVLGNVFEMWWPNLEMQINEQLANSAGGVEEARRTDRDMIEEVLALTRKVAMDRPRTFGGGHPAWRDVIDSVANLAKIAFSNSPDKETVRAIRHCLQPLSFIAKRERNELASHPGLSGHSVRRLREVEMMIGTDSEGDLEPPPALG